MIMTTIITIIIDIITITIDIIIVGWERYFTILLYTDIGMGSCALPRHLL